MHKNTCPEMYESKFDFHTHTRRFGKNLLDYGRYVRTVDLKSY